MRALVTGGLGFIGGYLCQELSQKGWKVRILDIRDKTKDIAFDGFDYISGDILDYSTVLEAMKGIDLVIHLAAKHRFFGISENEFYKVNVEGTKKILNAAAQVDIKNIIFYSSVAVYGDQSAPTNERTELQPNTPYGITKLEAEKLICKWSSEGVNRNALIIRPTLVFGPRNRGNMYRLIRQVDRGLYIPIGSGKNIKSVAYVENLIDATLFLMDKGFKGVEVYNYADEPHMSFKEIVNLIYKIFAKSVPKFYLPAWPILAGLKPFEFAARIAGKNFPIATAILKMNKSTYHTAKKIRNSAFQQIYSLEEGLTRMIEWYKSNREMERIQIEAEE